MVFNFFLLEMNLFFECYGWQCEQNCFFVWTWNFIFEDVDILVFESFLEFENEQLVILVNVVM